MRALPPDRHAPGGRLWTAPGRGPRILALHGFTGGGGDFEPLARGLGRPLLAPDLPGHGATPPPAGCSIERAARTLGQLSRRGGLRILLGYSLGGRHALHLASAHPGLFDALILIGASPGIADPAERAARARWDEGWARRIEREGVEPFLKDWAELPIIASQWRIPAPIRASMRRRRLLLKARGLAASLRGAGTGAMTPLWSALPSLALPTLLVVGQEDPRYRDLAARMASVLPRGRVAVIPGAGHCAHLERPDHAAARIQRFLNEVMERSGAPRLRVRPGALDEGVDQSGAPQLR